MTKLFVETIGDGEPVVLLHSSGFSGRQWKHLAAALADRGMRAVVPDLSGHGRSPLWPETEPFSFLIDVERIVEIVRALGTVRLVGHSYGGLVALHVARLEPAAIRSLHVFDPVAFGGLDPAIDGDVRDVLARLDLTWGDREKWLRTFVDFWGGDGAWGALREPVREEFRRIAWVVHEGVRSLMTDGTPITAYRDLRCPVRVMTGEQSPMPVRRVDDRLVEAIAGARLDIVPGGHLSPVIDPATTTRLVLDAI